MAFVATMTGTGRKLHADQRHQRHRAAIRYWRAGAYQIVSSGIGLELK